MLALQYALGTRVGLQWPLANGRDTIQTPSPFLKHNRVETRWPTSGTIRPLTAVDNLTTERNTKLCPIYITLWWSKRSRKDLVVQVQSLRISGARTCLRSELPQTPGASLIISQAYSPIYPPLPGPLNPLPQWPRVFFAIWAEQFVENIFPQKIGLKNKGTTFSKIFHPKNPFPKVSL